MASTLSDLITKVQQRVRDTGYSSSEITNYLNDAQNDIFNEYRLPFMQTSVNYVMAIGVADLTNGVGLPTDFVQAVDIVITTVGLESYLTPIAFEELDAIYPNAAISTQYGRNLPQYWYMYNQTIQVFQIPANAYTATMRYYKRPTNMVSDADLPSVPAEFSEALIMGAAYRVLQVKDNYDQATILQNKYDEILAKLVYRYSQTQVGTPTLMRTNRFYPSRRRF